MLPVIIGVAVLVGGGAFYGGMKYAQAKAPARGARTGQFAGAAGAGGRTGGAGARGFGGGFTSGQILSNDGKTLTLKLGTGGSKIVFLSDTTEVTKFVPGAATDLAVGKNVMVVGKANDDGSVTASSVQLRPDGMMPPGGRPDGGAPQGGAAPTPTPSP